MNILVENIKFFLAQEKISASELARRAGLLSQQISKIMTGEIKQPRGKTLEKIAKALNRTTEELIRGPKEKLFAGTINVVGYVAAGETHIAYDDCGLPVGGSVEEPVGRPVELKDSHAYALVVVGQSMGQIAPEGSRVVISPEATVKTRDLAIIRTKDDKVYIKEIRFHEGDLILVSGNMAEYPDMHIKKDDISFMHNVVWVKRP